MKKMLVFFSLLVMVLTASGYEGDTHFDYMYHMGRAAGLNHSMSLFLALANQHIDEKIISSPMLLSVQRQLFHFPGSIEEVKIEGHGVISLPKAIFKSKLALAERNSAIGNYLIYLGLVKGDLMLVGLGLHIKMDTYGHAGHSNILGHMEAGHNPDRAFLETKKYEDMTRSIMSSLVSIVQLLPEEAADTAAALKYLNKFAKNTHLNRDLTVADLKDSVIVSGVMLADTELQAIYKEDMFRKYEYKKLALTEIFKKFKKLGELSADITFNEVFPDDVIRDPRMTTKDVIKYVIVTTTDAEFLKSEGGKDIFNLQKLFGFSSQELFFKKFELERKRAEFRLRELNYLEEQERLSKEKYTYDISQWDSIIEDLHKENRARKEYGFDPMDPDPIRAIAERDTLPIEVIRDVYYRNKKIESERSELLRNIGGSYQAEFGSEDFYKKRAREIAEDRIAEEVAVKLTKDLVPNERTEYLKQNFEGDTITRKFEVAYKDNLYRLHRIKNWGVNFIRKEKGDGIIIKIKDAIVRFKSFITRTAVPKQIEAWKLAAEEAAERYMRLDSELTSRDRASIVGLDNANKRDAFFKLAAYVGPAIFPWVFMYKSGYSYIQSIIEKAKLHAKDHEVEDMKDAAKKGKYSDNLLTSKRSQKAAKLMGEFNGIRSTIVGSGASLKCIQLMSRVNGN